MTSLIQPFMQDLRYAARQLLKSKGFAITAVLSLACGIAASTAVFSVVWGVVMNPFPYASPDRMVHFAINNVNGNGYDAVPATAPQWREMRRIPALEDSAVMNYKRLTITGDEFPEDVRGSEMSSNAFNFFGVPVYLGRGLMPADALDGQDPQAVAVLGYKFWMRRFNGDPAIVGKIIQLEHSPYLVVGVAAKRFTWNDADVYLPLKITADPMVTYEVEARLKRGVTHKIAQEQLQGLIEQFRRETPKNFPAKPGPLTVIGLNEQFLQAIGPSLALLFGAVLLLLAVGCGNVSILLLARGAAREHEFAIRAAIGASRRRIVRQLLTEALLLSVSGAILGVLFAYKLLALIVALLPEDAIPHETAIAINTPVLLFSVVVALLTGILFGLSPALRLSKPDVREAMQSGARRVSGSSKGRLFHNVLVAGQIALTLLLLSVAGTATQGFLKLAHARLGYDPHNVMEIGVPVRSAANANAASRLAYMEQIRNKIAEIRGVQEVAIANAAIPPNNGINTSFQLLGRPTSQNQELRLNFVSENFFSTLHMTLMQGRLWSATENRNAAKVVVVNETLARRYFPGGDAIGHSLQIGILQDPPPFVTVAKGAAGWLQIIGVTQDKLNDGLRHPVLPEIYVPYSLGLWNFSAMLVRTDSTPMALVHTIAAQVASVNSNQQLNSQNRDLEHWISSQPEYAQGQLISSLFLGFAGLALLLAAIGLYSVVSYTVAQRTNEFGIRMALGAPRSNVLELVFRSTAASVLSGATAGLALTLAATKLLTRWTPGTAQSFMPLLLSVVVLGVVALIASGIPAHRAARIEPLEALRFE